MAGNHEFEYEVALSFAMENEEIVEKLAGLLEAKGIHVFYDEYDAELWGKDPVVHLINLYSRKARYCVLFLSQHYPLKIWTTAERARTQELALRDANEYILPLRLDEADVPGADEAPGYRDLRQHSLESIADLLEEKLAQTKGQAGPPPQSHDLRSGNVP